MKQTLFMIAMCLVGVLGLFKTTLAGVFVYHFFATLRPQYIWMWALPRWQWSQFVAVPTIIAVLLYRAATPLPFKTFTKGHLLTLLFFGWTTLSYFTAGDQDQAWLTYFVYLKMFIMFFVSAMVLNSTSALWRLTIVTATAVAYIAYEVNFLYFSTGYIAIYFNGYGGLDNNGAGLMLAMGVPLCLFIHLQTRAWWRWAFAIFIPIILHAVLMTFSRGAWVALLLAAPLMFLRGKNKKQLAAAAIAIAISVPFMAGQEIRKEFFSVESYEEDGSAQARFGSWKAAWLIALDNPIVGVGVRNSPLHSHRYGADQEGRVIHNNFLQILADSGFPALGLYVAVLLYTFTVTRRTRKATRHLEDDESRMAYGVACSVEASLGIFIIGGLFLSLEVFELPWLLILLGLQLPVARRASLVAAQTISTSEGDGVAAA